MLHSIKELFRSRIRASDGKVGKTDDFYFDGTSWAVRHVVVNTGRWLPASRVLIPPGEFGAPDPKARVIPVALTKKEVLQSADSETKEPEHRRQERLLQEHYGSALYARGGGPMGAVHGVIHNQAVALAEVGQGSRASGDDQDEDGQLRSAREVIGYKIEATDGPLGNVEDFLLDDQEWTISYIVVDTKDVRLPNRKVLTPPSWVQHMSWSESRVHMRVNREKIKRSQRYDPLSHSPLQKPKPFIWP